MCMARYYIIGIDEVGRGALAGPVTVAVVAIKIKITHKRSISRFDLDIFDVLAGIKDSKRLTPQQREEWAKKLKYDQRFMWAVASVSAKVIDKIGIAKAANLAVARVIRKPLRLSFNSFRVRRPSRDMLLLLDGGLKAPECYNQQTIIRGDETIPIIAAASIIAKVHRDRLMVRHHKRFPRYGFDSHKGYGTLKHRKAIRRYGVIFSLHRQRFLTHSTLLRVNPGRSSKG